MQTRPVKVRSLDFDNMLAAQEYAKELDEILKKGSPNEPLTDKDYLTLANNIISRNKEFFNQLFSDKNCDYVLMIGTNRQSDLTDLGNGNEKKSFSCYPLYSALENALKQTYKNKNITLDKILLQDIENNQKAGVTFNRIKNKYVNLSKKTVLDCINPEITESYNTFKNEFSKQDVQITPTDNEKIFLLYVQMHYAKLNNPNLTEFVFVDDTASILEALKEYYSKHAELIPPGITLSLQQHLPGDHPDPNSIHFTSTKINSSEQNILDRNVLKTAEIFNATGTPVVNKENDRSIIKARTAAQELKKFDNFINKLKLALPENKLNTKTNWRALIQDNQTYADTEIENTALSKLKVIKNLSNQIVKLKSNIEKSETTFSKAKNSLLPFIKEAFRTAKQEQQSKITLFKSDLAHNLNKFTQKEYPKKEKKNKEINLPENKPKLK